MDWLKWCQQLFPTKKNATINVTYRSGVQPASRFFGAVYWCSSYDENGPHWCDWKDGYWKDSTLDLNTVPKRRPIPPFNSQGFAVVEAFACSMFYNNTLIKCNGEC